MPSFLATAEASGTGVPGEGEGTFAGNFVERGERVRGVFGPPGLLLPPESSLGFFVRNRFELRSDNPDPMPEPMSTMPDPIPDPISTMPEPIDPMPDPMSDKPEPISETNVFGELEAGLGRTGQEEC